MVVVWYDHAWVVRFELCGSWGIFSTVQCRPYRPHHNRPARQPWHQETWKSLEQLHTLGYILLLRKDREPVSISNCLRLCFSMHAQCVHECVWNVSLYQITEKFELNWALLYTHPYSITTRQLMLNCTHIRFSCHAQNQKPQKGKIYSMIEVFTMFSEMDQIFKKTIFSNKKKKNAFCTWPLSAPHSRTTIPTCSTFAL